MALDILQVQPTTYSSSQPISSVQKTEHESNTLKQIRHLAGKRLPTHPKNHQVIPSLQKFSLNQEVASEPWISFYQKLERAIASFRNKDTRKTLDLKLNAATCLSEIVELTQNVLHRLQNDPKTRSSLQKVFKILCETGLSIEYHSEENRVIINLKRWWGTQCRVPLFKTAFNINMKTEDDGSINFSFYPDWEIHESNQNEELHFLKSFFDALCPSTVLKTKAGHITNETLLDFDTTLEGIKLAQLTNYFLIEPSFKAISTKLVNLPRKPDNLFYLWWLNIYLADDTLGNELLEATLTRKFSRDQTSDLSSIVEFVYTKTPKITSLSVPRKGLPEWFRKIMEGCNVEIGTLHFSPDSHVELSTYPSRTVIELHVSDCNVKGWGNVAKNTSLKVLNLSKTHLPHLGALVGAVNLQELDISDYPHSDDSLAQLRHFKNLRVLVLHHTAISTLAHLKSLESLEELDASHCINLRRGWNALSRMGHLRVLNLQETEFRDLAVLEGLPLTSLKLPAMKPTHPDVLTRLPYLTELHLSFRHMPKNTLEILKSRLDLKLVNSKKLS